MEEANVAEVSRLLVSSYRLLSALERLSPEQTRFLVSKRGSEECVRRESRSQDYLVARDTGAIVGVVAVSGETIAKLYVSPEHQRQGIGRSLYEAAESLIRATIASQDGCRSITDVNTPRNVPLSIKGAAITINALPGRDSSRKGSETSTSGSPAS